MRIPTRKWTRAAALAVALLALTIPAWSDGKFAANNIETKKLCYCGCDSKPGSAMCLHMCELAKYKNRWWAASCQKKQANPLAPPASSGQRNNSKTNNRTQEARL